MVTSREPTGIRVWILEVAGSGSMHLHPNLLTGLPTSTPNELDRRLDVRVKALFHGTGVRCVFGNPGTNGMFPKPLVNNCKSASVRRSA